MATTTFSLISEHTKALVLPIPNSRKGENGKLLIIGGSELFHAASAWSLEISARIVDMVFYSSIPSNNELVQQAKRSFWDGIVVPESDLEKYIEEAGAILIGPGMERSPDTSKKVNALLSSYPSKRWIIDAGALQCVDKALLLSKLKEVLITPNRNEFEKLFGEQVSLETVKKHAKEHPEVVMLVKGPLDYVVQNNRVEQISGGNAGMTKGGTGDVLAGLVAGLATNSPLFESAVVASYLTKQTSELLFADRDIFYSATDLIPVLGKQFANLMKVSTSSI